MIYLIVIIFCLFLRPFSVLAADNVSYIHTDQLGSVSLVTDQTGGVVAQQSYYPYGNTRSYQLSVDSYQLGERQYTGQVSDQNQTGLYYYNARYYNPTLAKFTQADTVNDQLNRYGYVGNNPINKSDPSGNMSIESEGPELSDEDDSGVPVVPKESEEDRLFEMNRYKKEFWRSWNWESTEDLFYNIGLNWLSNNGSPRIEEFDVVVKESLLHGIDPVFTLSIWLHESAGSNYYGLCIVRGVCQSVQDFGYNIDKYETTYSKKGEVKIDMLKVQLEKFLHLAAVYKERLTKMGLPVDTQHFFACYYYQDCHLDSKAVNYYNKINLLYKVFTSHDLPKYPLIFKN